jgi:4a-hydroxytetrahydrobiopterin dehydratase
MDNSSTVLSEKHCESCDEGTPRLLPEQINLLLSNLHDWAVTADGRKIRKEWLMRDFAAGLEFFDEVGRIAQVEDHHPDLHLFPTN